MCVRVCVCVCVCVCMRARMCTFVAAYVCLRICMYENKEKERGILLVGWLVGWILWHMNLCWLLCAKSCIQYRY